VVADVPDAEVHGDRSGVLVVSWGGTFGAVRSGVDAARLEGLRVGHVHLRWLNPMPQNLGALLAQYDKVLVPELNLGQLWRLLRDRFLVDAVLYSKMQGRPFKVSEIKNRIVSLSTEA
jgi:2-oxoglutarate ferredoxin oxidoreductase subunit alpha